MMNRTSLIKLIHVARRELQLDDDTYRAFLLQKTGKSSCRELTEQELSGVLDGLKQRGFKVRSAPVDRALKPGSVTAKIRTLWRLMHRQGFLRDGSGIALSRWVASQTATPNGGAGVARYQWLERDGEMAVRVLEGLKRWHRREMLRALSLPESYPASYGKVCRMYGK